MGIVVLGMHRSGTSAMTELVSTFGYETGDRQTLLGGTFDNPRGYFEVESLMHVNDTILGEAGGAVYLPPSPQRIEASFTNSAKDHLEAFRSHFDGSNYVWKDPRLCLTLNEWKRVLTDLDGAVLMVRDPQSIASSLARRGDVPDLPASIALWEVYIRSALTALTGMKVLVVNYDQMIDNPDGAFRSLTDAIRAFDGSEPPLKIVLRSVLKGDLKRSEPVDVPMAQEQEELQEHLRSLVGYHETFDPGTQSPVSACARQVLATRMTWLSMSPEGIKKAVGPTTYRATRWPIDDLLDEADEAGRERDSARAMAAEQARRYDEIYAKYLTAVDAIEGAVAARGSALGQLRLCQGDILSARTEHEEWERSLFRVTSELEKAKAELESLRAVTGRRVIRSAATIIRDKTGK